ncbi:MAG: putative Ig domain-containing protein, partial [Gemmatimonadota bacterium]
GDGVTYTWTLVAGALPPGLQLDAAGRLTGSPGATGSFAFTLRVASGTSGVERAFTLRVVPDQRAAYNLTVYPVVSVPAAIQPHLDAAVARWERVVSADVQGGPVGAEFFTAQHCSGFGQEANGASVDDLLVMVNIDSIDGPGRVLGQAGPCGLRGNGLPFVGILILDEDDLTPLVGTSTLTAIITHEIGHVMGIGALWDRFELLSGAGTTDPGYTGAAGMAAYQQLGGQAERVPVENQGGQGTAGSHWRESVFDTELLTGFSEPVGVPQPLSILTVASLVDLGYVVDADAADAYSLPAAGLRSHDTAPADGFDIVGAGPLRVAPWGHRSTLPPSPEPERP